MTVCCFEHISRNVVRLPGKTALVFEGSSLSYAALETRSRSIARALRAQGISLALRRNR